MRRCSVSFVDFVGLRYSVDVDAGSLFEAAASALETFRKAECTARIPAYARLDLLTSEGKYSVGLAHLREWAGRTPKSPKEMILKERLKKAVESIGDDKSKDAD